MAETLLSAVNSLLKDAGFIQGSAGALTTLTDAQRQSAVDQAVAAWNQVVRRLMRPGVFPNETAQGTLTLVAGQSSYSFTSDMSITDFEKIVGNPIDATNNNILYPWPGGWLSLRSARRDISDYQGLPNHWAINTTNGNMELDQQPTTTEEGCSTWTVHWR